MRDFVLSKLDVLSSSLIIVTNRNAKQANEQKPFKMKHV